jgi:hypothetical protein
MMHQSLQEVTLAAYSFDVLEDAFNFYRFDDGVLPENALSLGGFIIGANGDESIIAPAGVSIDGYSEMSEGWRCLKIREDLSFSEVGVAAAITADLAGEGISVLVMSGYSHDYFFLKADHLQQAIDALKRSGYGF